MEVTGQRGRVLAEQYIDPVVHDPFEELYSNNFRGVLQMPDQLIRIVIGIEEGSFLLPFAFG